MPTNKRKPHNTKPHDKHYPFELSDTHGRVGCYQFDTVASQIGRATGEWYQIRNLKDEIIEEAS